LFSCSNAIKVNILLTGYARSAYLYGILGALEKEG
jgi:hypothetical protein